MTSAAATPLVPAGRFHRLAFATGPHAGLADWLHSVLGARRHHTTMRQVQGLPFGGDRPAPTPDETGGRSAESGARSEILWLGTAPLCLLVPDSEEGPLGRYVAAHGTGLHSFGWTVDDLWGADAELRNYGARITGVDIAGRHFFVHPADTAGILIEFTDTEFTEDPRDTGFVGEAPKSVVDGAELAWTTAVVPDIDAALATLAPVISYEQISGLPTEDCTCCASADLRIGDTVLRLVTPLSDESRFAGARYLHSFCVSVPDLEATADALAGAGIGITSRDATFLWTDPSDTCGLTIQWTSAR